VSCPLQILPVSLNLMGDGRLVSSASTNVRFPSTDFSEDDVKRPRLNCLHRLTDCRITRTELRLFNLFQARALRDASIMNGPPAADVLTIAVVRTFKDDHGCLSRITSMPHADVWARRWPQGAWLASTAPRLTDETETDVPHQSGNPIRRQTDEPYSGS
jgi:hypothetical protein